MTIDGFLCFMLFLTSISPEGNINWLVNRKIKNSDDLLFYNVIYKTTSPTTYIFKPLKYQNIMHSN